MEEQFQWTEDSGKGMGALPAGISSQNAGWVKEWGAS